MEVDVALEVDFSGQPLAGRNQDAAASSLMARGDRFPDCLRYFSISFCAEVSDFEIPLGKHRNVRVRHFEGGFDRDLLVTDFAIRSSWGEERGGSENEAT